MCEIGCETKIADSIKSKVVGGLKVDAFGFTDSNILDRSINLKDIVHRIPGDQTLEKRVTGSLSFQDIGPPDRVELVFEHDLVVIES